MKQMKLIATAVVIGLCFHARAAARTGEPAVLLDMRSEPRGVTLQLSRPTGFRTSVSGVPPVLLVVLDDTTPAEAARSRTLTTPVTGVSITSSAGEELPTTTVALTLDGPREYAAAWSKEGISIEFRDLVGGDSSSRSVPSAEGEAVMSAPAAGGGVSPRPLASAKDGNALVDSLSTEPIDFNFRDSDLLGILRNFAVKFNRNIVTGPGVGGRVNIQLRNVPFDEAFATMLSQMELVAIKKSANVIEVIKVSEMPVQAQMFALKYRFAPEIMATITAALDSKEKARTVVAVDLGSNSLIVTSTNDMLQKVKRMVDQLDIESPQISIRARLIEVTAGSSFNWGMTYAAEARTDNSDGKTTGRAILDMGNFTVGGNGVINSLNTVTKFPTGGILDFTAVLDRKTYYGLINMIKSDTRNKTISEPMILTGNNKSSKIHVGQNLPVKTSQVGQTSTVQTIQFIPEGIDLDVTPIVSPGSNIISFKIKVGVSEFLNFVNEAPVTTERTASTEVSVESGKTVVIAGLMRDKQTLTDTGIPFLKDIPLIGYFFKKKGKTNDKTELLIFITPELLSKA